MVYVTRVNICDMRTQSRVESGPSKGRHLAALERLEGWVQMVKFAVPALTSQMK